MVTIQDAIQHATDNGMTVSDIRESGMMGRKYFVVTCKDSRKAITVAHRGGKMWVVLGAKPLPQAQCILEAVHQLLDGRAVR